MERKKEFQRMTRKAKKQHTFEGYVRFTMNATQQNLGTATVSVEECEPLGETALRARALESLKAFQKSELFQNFLATIEGTSKLEETTREVHGANNQKEHLSKYTLRIFY